MATAEFQAFFDSLGGKIEQPVRTHLKNVYSSLSMCLLAAAAGGYIHLFTNLLEGSMFVMLVGLGLLVALGMTPDNGKNQTMRLGFLLGFALTAGLNLGPLMEMVIRVDPSIIPTAFIGTSVVFICFSISAMISEQTKWLYLGGILMAAQSLMLYMALANLFFRSSALYQVNLYLGLPVLLGFILYDTQMIIKKRRQGDRDYIWHCVTLFVDFISLFRRLLIILTQKEEDSRRRSNRD